MTTLNRFDVDIKAVKDGEGEFEAVLSVPTVDRDGEIIDARAFEPLPEYIPIDVDHGMSVTSTVGSGTPYYDGETLRFRGTFASTQLGQEVRTLVLEQHIRKMSVAFMSAQRSEDEDGTPHIVKAELLNAAIVAIPSNREADILAAKALDLKATKAASLQQIHDLAASAGAECSAKNAHPADDRGQVTHDGVLTPTISTDTDPADPEVAPPAPLADVAVARARAIAGAAHLAL
jgi:hypothetical protein